MTSAAPIRFTGRTALLTAAGSGIGEATAHRLAAEGASVYVTDIDASSAHRVAEQIRLDGGQASSGRLDVTSPQDWAVAVDHVIAWKGQLDVLHLNAGRNLRGSAHELDDASWHDQLRLSLDSVFYGVRAAVPQLRATCGAVVITSSVHAVIGFKGFPAYAAAKGGIGALVRQLAVEYGRQQDGVRFNAVLPGAVDTPLMDGVSAEAKANIAAVAPVGRIGTPQDIAAAVAFLASDDASFITGQNLLVDGGRSITAH
ncbi:SDR family NAD(P)-dependent oxidoreductase [Streptomyces scopuliridis]|uniref:SDR family NAD(P)-dependent oxidoreductase n=1 Tax=Streptomyces scopuliridis TaxID=452529 RepID=UPI0036B660A5